MWPGASCSGRHRRAVPERRCRRRHGVAFERAGRARRWPSTDRGSSMRRSTSTRRPAALRSLRGLGVPPSPAAAAAPSRAAAARRAVRRADRARPHRRGRPRRRDARDARRRRSRGVLRQFERPGRASSSDELGVGPSVEADRCATWPSARVARTARRRRPGHATARRARSPRRRVHFCTTTDGVRLAYASSGSGPPLVKASNWLTHLDYDWDSPVWQPLVAGAVVRRLHAGPLRRARLRPVGLGRRRRFVHARGVGRATSRPSSTRSGSSASRCSASRRAARSRSPTPRGIPSG